VPTTTLPFGSMLRVEELTSPPALTMYACDARQRCQAGSVTIIEQAIHDRRQVAEKRARNGVPVARADGAEHVLDPMIGLCKNVANV